MDADTGRDLADWIEWTGILLANVTIVGGGVVAVWKALPKLNKIAAATERRAEAEERMADAQENAALVVATDAKKASGESLSDAAARVRAEILFDAYKEWRGQQHLAAGGAAAALQGAAYDDWLRRALHLLEVVLIQAARTANESEWVAVVQREMADHDIGLARLNENDFSNGKVRELIRAAKVRLAK